MAAPTILPNIEIVKTPLGFLRHPTYVCELVLAAGAAKPLTVPVLSNGQHAHHVIFWADCDFRVGYDQTAFVAGADITDGTACEGNPAYRYVGGVTTLSLYSVTGGRVTMAFYTS